MKSIKEIVIATEGANFSYKYEMKLPLWHHKIIIRLVSRLRASLRSGHIPKLEHFQPFKMVKFFF